MLLLILPVDAPKFVKFHSKLYWANTFVIDSIKIIKKMVDFKVLITWLFFILNYNLN